MKVTMLNPMDILYENDDVEIVAFSDGSEELSLMDLHQPIISKIAAGPIKIKEKEEKGGNVKLFIVSGGLLFMQNNDVKILSEDGFKK